MAIMDEIKAAPEIVALTNVEVLSYSTQVVAGTNYIISLKHAAGTSDVKVFKALPHTGEAAKVVSITHAFQAGAAVLSSYTRGDPAAGIKFEPAHTKFRAPNDGEAKVSASSVWRL